MPTKTPENWHRRLGETRRLARQAALEDSANAKQHVKICYPTISKSLLQDSGVFRPAKLQSEVSSNVLPCVLPRTLSQLNDLFKEETPAFKATGS